MNTRKRKSGIRSWRIRGAVKFQVFWWAWDCPLGYRRDYYDGWNNQFNFGFVCFTWLTPPLIGDL